MSKRLKASWATYARKCPKTKLPPHQIWTTTAWTSSGIGPIAVPENPKLNRTPFPINTPLRQAAWAAARLSGAKEFEREVAVVEAEVKTIAQRLYPLNTDDLICVNDNKGYGTSPDQICITVKTIREKLILPGVTKFKTTMRAVTYQQNFKTGEFNWEAICNKAYQHAQYLKAREEKVTRLKSIFPEGGLVQVTEGGELIIELHPKNEQDATSILDAIKRAMGKDEEKIYELGQAK
jgi:hypothetical protein